MFLSLLMLSLLQLLKLFESVNCEFFCVFGNLFGKVDLLFWLSLELFTKNLLLLLMISKIVLTMLLFSYSLLGESLSELETNFLSLHRKDPSDLFIKLLISHVFLSFYFLQTNDKLFSNAFKSKEFSIKVGEPI